MKIYFAGSIRGGRDDQALYFDIIGRLGLYGRVLTEHVGGSGLDSHGEEGSDREIHDRDIAWLREADCLVAEVTTPSLGVGYEVGRALEWGKPILCLYRRSSGRALSAMIAGSGGVKLRVYESTADLDEIVREFFGTVQKMMRDKFAGKIRVPARR
jgi:nucleoside 2-deoxyribosyltransferase